MSVNDPSLPAPPLPQSTPSPQPQPQPPARPPGGRTVEQVEGDLANVRAEAAAHRISARDASDRVTALQGEITTIRAEADQRVEAARNEGNAQTTTWKGVAMQAELKAAALAAGLVDVDLLPLIDRTRIVVGENGTITGIPEAIAEFKTRKPTYFQGGVTPAPAPGAPGARPAPQSSSPTLPNPPANPNPPLTDVGTLSKEDYQQRKRAALRDLRQTGRR